MTTITPSQLNDRLLRGEQLRLLDVRTPSEHAQIHVQGVHLLPLDRLNAAQLVGVNGFTKDQPIYIFCRSGDRATQAAVKLEKGGYQECQVVKGGTEAWAKAGLPVERGPSKVLSLERQVRIAAGVIVLTGVLLAQFASPAFIWLSGLIGAGLTFSGITGLCGMGMLLAKMPWNQRGIETRCAI